MIKIRGTSDQKIDENDIVINGNYTRDVSLFGIKVYSKHSSIINKSEGIKPDKKVGFGKK
jgi:hypothetical protein